METYDLRGLKCPLPVLKTRHRMRGLQAGVRVEVLSDDPLAGVDIPHFCNEFGQILVEQGEGEDGCQRFVVERTEGKI